MLASVSGYDRVILCRGLISEEDLGVCLPTVCHEQGHIEHLKKDCCNGEKGYKQKQSCMYLLLLLYVRQIFEQMQMRIQMMPLHSASHLTRVTGKRKEHVGLSISGSKHGVTDEGAERADEARDHGGSRGRWGRRGGAPGIFQVFLPQEPTIH